MTDAGAPFIEITGLEKRYQGIRPLRVAHFRVGKSDRFTLGGFDVGAAEMFVHLITGASVPDAGEVLVAGKNTRDIATDTEWLTSLDRFGIVTERAILLGSLSIAANLALPMTLAIDPMEPAVMAKVEALAASVGLSRDRLAAAASSLSAIERVRVHMARAVAVDPEVLLLEHPTAQLAPAEAEALGASLQALAEARGLAWVALTEDEAFARAAGGTRLRLNGATGVLEKDGGFWKRLTRGAGRGA